MQQQVRRSSEPQRPASPAPELPGAELQGSEPAARTKPGSWNSALGSQLREVLREELQRLSQGLREDVRAELQSSLAAGPGRGRSRAPSLTKETLRNPEEEWDSDLEVVKLPAVLPPAARGLKSARNAKTMKDLTDETDGIDAALAHRPLSRPHSPAVPVAGVLREQPVPIHDRAIKHLDGADGSQELRPHSAGKDSDGERHHDQHLWPPPPGPHQRGSATLDFASKKASALSQRLSRSLSSLRGAEPTTMVQPFANSPQQGRRSTTSVLSDSVVMETSEEFKVPGALVGPGGEKTLHVQGSRSRTSSRMGDFETTSSNEEAPAITFTRINTGTGDRRRSQRRLDSADKAMALARTKSADLTHSASVAALKRSSSQQLALQIVRSTAFEFFVMVMITASAVHIGIQIDYMARHTLRTTPFSHRVMEILFCAAFTVEIFLRIYAYRCKFFRMYGWAWNAFDLILVLSQLGEEIIMVASAASGQDIEAWNGGFLLRTARVLRAIRAIRVLHIARFTNELRLIMACIVHALRSFFWASALLMLMIYVVGIYLTQVVLVHRLETSDGSQELRTWYGNVPRAVLSLFQGLTGGLDWDVLIAPLIDISPWLGVTFVLYTLFAIFAVMNVVTALFVESALRHAGQVKEVQQVDQAMRLFRRMDISQAGVITYEDLANNLECEEVQDFFSSIDVDVSEAKSLFEMLDIDGSGVLEFEEFLNGCMRLQGPAKAVDLVLAARDMKMNLEVQGAVMRECVRDSVKLDPSTSHVSLPHVDAFAQKVLKAPFKHNYDLSREEEEV